MLHLQHRRALLAARSVVRLGSAREPPGSPRLGPRTARYDTASRHYNRTTVLFRRYGAGLTGIRLFYKYLYHI